MTDSDSQAARDEAQRNKIVEEKKQLNRQLMVLIILSLLISGTFYGITMVQNPYLKPTQD